MSGTFADDDDHLLLKTFLECSGLIRLTLYSGSSGVNVFHKCVDN